MTNELLFLSEAFFIGLVTFYVRNKNSALLTALVCTYCLMANLFVIKQITFFGFHASNSDVFTIGATLSLNMLQEYFGPVAARQAIFINFFILVLYMICTQFHLLYVPSIHDTSQVHYTALLKLAPRIVLVSLLVYLLVQYLDYKLYGFLKQKYEDRYLVLRNYASVIVCQFIDTVLFSLFALWGLVHNIWHIIVVSYAVKLVAIIISTAVLHWAKDRK